MAAGDKLCNICFSNEHEAGTMGVSSHEDPFDAMNPMQHTSILREQLLYRQHMRLFHLP